MKKSHLALALLATFAGTAAAQSNVTLFGLVDVNITHYTAGDNSNAISTANPTGAGKAPSRTAMEDGTTNGMNGSRWGIRVTEELGGGWSAGTLLESGFDLSQGSSFQGGRLFGRQAFLFVNSTTLGNLRLGRQYVLSDNLLGYGAPFGTGMGLLGNPSTGVVNNGRSVATILNPSRADNVVQYTTPNFAGFTGAIQYAPDENTFDDFYGVAVNYNRGPINVGVSYEWNKQRLAPNDKVNKTLSVGANYDFGFLKLLAAYQKVDDLRVSLNGIAGGVSQRLVGQGAQTLTINDQDAWVAGVEVPIGKITRVALLYTTIDYDGAPTAAGQPSSYSLGKTALELKHDLSRRTFLYAGVSQASGDLSDHITAYRQYQVGFQHRF